MADAARAAYAAFGRTWTKRRPGIGSSPARKATSNLLDGRLNGYRHGGMMNVPVAFRRPYEWRALFESRGLNIIALKWLGSRFERLVHHPVLFVMDK